MKWRFALVILGVTAMTCVTPLRADESGQPKKADASAQVREDVTLKEQILSRQFAEFQQSLLRLKQKLERSTKLEDRERAKILDRVLQKAKDELISTQFSQIVDFLRDQKFANIGDVKKAVEQSKSLAEDLRVLLALLREDTRAGQLRDQRMELEKLLKKIEEAIKTQKAVQGQTDLGKTEKTELKNLQGKATKQTEEIARAMEGANKEPNFKGDPKDSGKNAGKSGKTKDAGEAGKTAESKDGGKEGGEKKADAKGGKEGSEAPKSGKEGDKAGEPKSGKSGEGSESKPAGAKESKEGGEGKQGGSKENPAGGEKKGNEAEAKKSGGDEGAKIKTKTKEQDPDAEKDDKEGKAGAKSGGKQGEEGKKSGAKGSESGKEPQQAGEKKSGEQKQGEAKAGSESQSQGQPKSGQQKPGEQQAGSKGGQQQPQQPQPPSQQKPQDEIAKKQVEDANYKQQQAEEKIAKEENKEASEKQGQAIKDLETAKKKLEDLLRQIREEELERLLAALQQRCERMLAMQIQVLHGTEQTDTGIKANADKKASRKNEQDSLKLSDDEKDIVREADKAVEMLEAEGSAVAFPEVFQQVREDMKHVQRRLGVVDVGVVTQAIEKDIIDTLKEMIDALKKARQENQAKQQQGQPKDSQTQPNADQKLLDQIAELKMIRSMQIRVNKRTETYGQQYEGEQAFEMEIRGELQNLAERQDRIVTVTSQIAKGDNR